MPKVLSMALPAVNGEVDVKTAWIPGFDGFAIKVSPGFFDNPKRGLASLNGLMILLSASTGLVEAVFLDNGYLTDVRTAAAGAVAARHMAPATIETAGVLGTGVQARLQIAAARARKPATAVTLPAPPPAARSLALDRKLALDSVGGDEELLQEISQLFLEHVPRWMQEAKAAYRAALALGGSRPLPELFTTAHACFDFGGSMLGTLTHAVMEELRAEG